MKNEIKSGTILISKPFMEDSRFEKTIILIVESSKEGTMGFILNKSTNSAINLIIKEINSADYFNYGGPVDTNHMFFIHKKSDLISNSTHIINDLYFGGDLENVITLLQSKKIKSDEILFFLGYTGWEKNQLNNEIQEGSWIIHEMELNDIKQNLEWSNLLININQEYSVWATAPNNFHLN